MVQKGENWRHKEKRNNKVFIKNLQIRGLSNGSLNRK